ncbi:thymidylate synthase [Leifsonia sp. AK011]|uniref:thymidylate synthase n=1 Tax=Leifsonia sp. AK011 TaxID=2723075 RepID=UPI0015C9F6CB|nr:thymidylate synthase [Leifsonia sp. AK011]NYF09918.1 thymidylate synthase [Leifsonia sp. AK011]
MTYRNAATAFIAELRDIKRRGAEVTVRGMPTRELLARTVSLARPTERCITIPGRRNDCALAIAETMWVLQGRNDLEFLSRYVERAPNYSDDGGKTWRAAYGPRLRRWGASSGDSVDQIREVYDLLRRDPSSRRAVIALFDPAQDFIEITNDVPCNNWLHFLIRDGRLDLNIVVRSNDVIWGFSGINTFEWSVLHEMLAFWLGVEVGKATFFISSLHLYTDRDKQAIRILEGANGSTGYEKGWCETPFQTAWDEFGARFDEWFAIEAEIAAGKSPRDRIDQFPDPLLRQFLQMLELYWAKKAAASDADLRVIIDRLGHSDLAFAATEDVFRNSADLPRIGGEATVINGAKLRDAIIRLHRAKDESYKNAWKKRGEQMGIASNIARKVDRVEHVAAGADPGDESLLDTAIDLFVYCLKYQTYLADQDGALAPALVGGGVPPFSDGPSGFEVAIGQFEFSLDGEVPSVAAAAMRVVDGLAQLEAYYPTALPHDWSARVPFAQQLTRYALDLLLAVIEVEPFTTAEFIESQGL